DRDHGVAGGVAPVPRCYPGPVSTVAAAGSPDPRLARRAPPERLVVDRPMFEVSPLAAARAAYLAAACNLAAVLAIALLLRPGLPGADTTPVSRWLFVRASPLVWWAGWLVWHLAAVALLGFYVALA